MSEPLILPLGPGDPELLGSYQLIGLLGHGGMGRVYLGVSPDFGQVAVKVMHPQFAGDTAFRQRFKREAETAQRVSGRFTARVLDSGMYSVASQGVRSSTPESSTLAVKRPLTRCAVSASRLNRCRKAVSPANWGCITLTATWPKSGETPR